DGPHARRERPGRLGALQLGDGFLEPPHGGVAVPGVEAGGAHGGGHGPTFLHRGGDEGGRRPQDRRERRVVVLAAGEYRPGLGTVGRRGSARRAGRGGLVGVAHRSFSIRVRKLVTWWPTCSGSSRNPSWPWGLSMIPRVLSLPRSRSVSWGS